MLSTYRIKVAGRTYLRRYRSSCEAILAAQRCYRVHNATAKKVAA